MLSQYIENCQNLHGLCALVSDLKPVGGLGTREVRVMSGDASDTIPISLIVKKCLEFTGSQSTLTPAEQTDYQRILDKIKILDQRAFTELQKNQLTQQLQTYLSDSTISGNKALVVQRIQEAFHCQNTRLDLSNLQITEVPSCLSMLPWLQVLLLYSNQLATLPSEIRTLTKLQTLSLDNNQLTAVPPEVEALPQLCHLYLSNNQLATLPPGIGALTKLQTLSLSTNQLVTLPSEIRTLIKLQTLSLDNNQLATLPPEVEALPQLCHLFLGNNQLATLPPGIEALSQLQILDLNNNQLIAVPPEIGVLTQLHTLDLGNNQLTAVPPEIGTLIRLQVLNLQENCDLRELPPILESMPELTHIDTDGTALDTQVVQAILHRCAVIRQRLRDLHSDVGG